MTAKQWAWLALLLLMAVTVADAKVYLVSVGIADYPGTENDLNLPVRDAKTVTWLYTKNTSVDFALLQDEQATKERIVAAMRKVYRRAGVNDMVVLFYSGHGYQGGFCAYDGNLSYGEVRKAMAVSNCQNKMIFADACFSGDMRTGEHSSQSAVSAAKNANVMLFLSLRSNETSAERPSMKNGFFTTYLQKGMRGGADKNRDRIITARINAGRKVSVGDELKRDIDAHRNQYMTWLVNVLKAALADTAPVDTSINRRHPDYGVFAVRCGRAFGDERGAIQAMETAEIDKAALPLLNDTVAKEIVAVLRGQPTPGSLRFTASDMSDMIIKRFGDDDSDDNTKKIYGPRRIGKAINKLSREFSTLFAWTSGTIEGRTRYDFTGLTTQGKLLFDPPGGADGGGLVDLNSTSGKSPLENAHAGDFFQNAQSNPPNPPEHARAQAQSDFSTVKGKDNGRLENDGLDDDDFDPEDFEL